MFIDFLRRPDPLEPLASAPFSLALGVCSDVQLQTDSVLQVVLPWPNVLLLFELVRHRALTRFLAGFELSDVNAAILVILPS